jgi:hypothetical protein
MPPAGFEPGISESKRPQTHTYNRAATGINSFSNTQKQKQIADKDFLNVLQIFIHKQNKMARTM